MYDVVVMHIPYRSEQTIGRYVSFADAEAVARKLQHHIKIPVRIVVRPAPDRETLAFGPTIDELGENA